MERHEHPWTQRLHVVATVAGVFCVAVMFPLTFNGAWLIRAVVHHATEVAFGLAALAVVVLWLRGAVLWRDPFGGN